MRFAGTVPTLVGLIFILGLAAPSRGDIAVIQDGEFLNWSMTVHLEGGEGGAVMIRHDSGGNPGAFVEVETWSGWQLHAWGLLWKADTIWDPSSGDINSVAFQIDERAISSYGSGQNMKLLVRQNGRYYGAPIDPWGTVTDIEPYWLTYLLGPVVAADFGEWLPNGTVNLSSKPDFSSVGADMQFGFLVGVSSVLDMRVHGFDNWQVTIDYESPTAVERTSWGAVRGLYR